MNIKGHRPMKQKLKIQIKITACEDGIAEGTWHGHDTDGDLQACAIAMIEKAFASAWPKAEADLYDADGRAVNEDTSHGEFVCYRDGLPR
tara:strand:+ start:1594 stop:1863 length:270 start_codon:yes stop_codon:yes gene_type:complete